MVHNPPQQPPHIVQPPSIMYTTQAPNFQQVYGGNLQMQQPTVMFVPSRPRLQQSWIVSNGPPMSTYPPTSTTYHIQPPLPPQPTFSGGFNMPQPPFSGGTAMSQPSFSGSNNLPQHLLNNGTGIPQPPFSGGTAVLKRKSHFLEESDFDSSVSCCVPFFLIS